MPTPYNFDFCTTIVLAYNVIVGVPTALRNDTVIAAYGAVEPYDTFDEGLLT
jgi:hypothetical protein